MLDNIPPVTSTPGQGAHGSAVEESPQEAPERLATIWVGRITFIIGGAFLIMALVTWALRPGHYRILLAMLVIAMFCAILHSYTFETNGRG